MAWTLLGLAGPLAGQVTLDQGFDAGALDVAASTVDLTDPARPIVTLEPRRFPGAWPGDHWWVSFALHGVQGRTPRLRIPTAGAFQAYTSSHRWAWSATPADETSWAFFDNGFIDVNAYFRSANLTPFAADDVWVATAIPYPFARTQARAAALVGHPLVTPTASSDASFVLGTTAGTAGGGYTDDLGRAVPALPLYAYRITDGGAGPRHTIVVMAGNHSGEPTGSWTLEGFVDFVLGDDPEAVLLRHRADVLVYPEVDPEGRSSGYFRSNPEHPTLNHNTGWDDPAGRTDVALVAAAMQADAPGGVDVFVDFHAYGSATDVGYLAPTSNARTALFLDALRALEPALVDLTAPNPQPIATAARWAAAPQGLSAAVAVTSEAGTLAGQGVARYRALGERYARAALAAIEGAPRVRRPGSGKTFRESALALDPALYLAFDEGGGTTAVDGSGNGRDGMTFGAVGWTADTPFVASGRRALKLEGTAGSPGGETVRVHDFPYTGPGGAFTLAFWFRTSAIAGTLEQHVFNHGTGSQPNSIDVYFEETSSIGTGDRLRTVVLDANDPAGQGAALDVALAPADGRWHFYTLVVQPGAGATLYLDGFRVEQESAILGQAYDPTGLLVVGARANLAAGSFYGRTGAGDGFVDELLLFPRALDAEQVLELARAPARLFGEAGARVSFDEGLLVVRDAAGRPRDALVAARPAGEPAATPVLLFVPAVGLRVGAPAELAPLVEWEAWLLPRGERP